MTAIACTDCGHPATRELVRMPGPNRPMCDVCSRPAAMTGMWIRPLPTEAENDGAPNSLNLETTP